MLEKDKFHRGVTERVGLKTSKVVSESVLCRQNRLKIGNWPFWSKFKRFDREINIVHKHIPKIYFNRR